MYLISEFHQSVNAKYYVVDLWGKRTRRICFLRVHYKKSYKIVQGTPSHLRCYNVIAVPKIATSTSFS